MAKTIYDVTLLELLPQNLRNDPDIIAASKALDTQTQLIAEKIKKCLVKADIDNASSEVVDNLAGEWRTGFYDQSFTLAKRRELVKRSLVYKYTKGTAAVVKEIAQAAFDNVSVLEWYEYGGEPYMFSLVFDGEMPDNDELNKVIAAINSVKNVRSHLDTTQVKETETMGVYFGGIIVQTERETIEQLEAIDYTNWAVTMPGVTNRI